MFESMINFFKKLGKTQNTSTDGNKDKTKGGSKDKAKERLHLVLMQDRANVSADFLELMKQEIIDVIKKYIEIEEGEIDVRLTNEIKEDGTTGAPSLYANIPIINIRNDMKKDVQKNNEENKKDEKSEKTDKDTENKEENNKEEKEENKEQKEENKEEKNKEAKNKENSSDNKK